jgi:small-conductance mechanosensitive channel/CRP-like cAMP-binding protein
VNTYLPPMIEAVVVLVIWLIATGVTMPLRRRLDGEMERKAHLAATIIDQLAHVSRPLMILIVTEITVRLLGMWPAGDAWLTSHEAHRSAWQIFWFGLTVIALLDGVVHAFFHHREEDFPIPGLLFGILKTATILALAFVIIRFELGINIGPLLASTALLTAVIGFALQGVLGNLLSGMSLHLARSLREGVWIEIEGIEGKVIMTNWRETRVRTRGGHVHIIPNSKVAEARIHNMSDPSPLRMHRIEVGASYSDAPDEVIEALLEAARTVPYVKISPAPSAMITAYLDFGINYVLTFWTTEYYRHLMINGEVNRVIWYQFKRRGIEIPFPMSDKLLNDFMAVVYNQRKLPPTVEDNSSVVHDLLTSDLVTKLVLDQERNPLLTLVDLEAVAPLVRRLKYTHGETICSQGESDETFWVLANGRLAGEVGRNNDTAIRFELEPGSVVGEMSALTGVPRSATITVSESSELLEFGPAAFHKLLTLHDEIPERLSDLAAERAAQNREALEALSKQQANNDVVLEKAGILGRLKKIIGK